MNILLFTGKYSTLSVPFLRVFEKKVHGDNLIVFLGEPLNRNNNFSVLKILKKNKITYLIKKVFQVLDIFLRSMSIKIVPFMGIKYSQDYIKLNNIRYYNISDINAEDTIRIIKENQIDIILIYDCGQILKKVAIESASIACINVHSSLLPKYRGTSPIYWVLKNKEKETGVTIHLVDAGIDTGDIILQKSIDIPTGMTERQLSKKLSELGAELIVETIMKFKNKGIQLIKQNSKEATYYSNIKRIY